MKKTAVILLSTTLAFTACKKEQNATPDNTAADKGKTPALAKTVPTGLADRISVSASGYLVIPDSNAYADYINFLEGNSQEDIASFHNSIGFVSQASVEGQAGNYIAPSEANGAYVFNQSGIVQIGSVLYRGVNSQGYMLAMPVANLNETTYAAMVSKTFLPQSMCRLKIGGSYGDNLEAFVNSNPGYDDPSNPPTPPVVCERKVTHTYTGGGVTIVDESWYFLGFRYKHVITIYDGRP